MVVKSLSDGSRYRRSRYQAGWHWLEGRYRESKSRGAVQRSVSVSVPATTLVSLVPESWTHVSPPSAETCTGPKV